MMPPSIFPTPEARDAAIRRIQRFLNTRQDMFSLPRTLHVNGELDEATCDALNRAAEFSKSWGEDAISGNGDDASLAALDVRLRNANYSFDLDRQLRRHWQAHTPNEKKRWWRSLQGLLEAKGMHFEQAYANPHQVAKKLASYITHEDEGKLLGWLGSEGHELPAPIPEYLAPVLAAMPGKRDATALNGYQHIPAPSYPVWAFEPTVVTYSFAVPDGSTNESTHHRTPQALTVEGQQLTRDCMAELEQVCGVKFVEIKAPQKAQLHIYVDEGRSLAGRPVWRGNVPMRPAGDIVPVIFNEATGNGLKDVDDARRVRLHELGHALGLSHPHSPAEDYSRRLARPLDNINHSMMSYFYLPHQPLADNPMGLDIAALQKRFGPPRVFNEQSRAYRIAENATPVRRTLYDRDAALDWIDASNQQAVVRIDLRPGMPQHSRIGQHRLWIAPGSKIEGAIGGKNHDVLIAGEGQSYLMGGDGNDRFEILSGGHHRILDMQANDTLMLGAALRKQGASYAETPWGLTLRVGAEKGKVPLVLDIATTDKKAVEEKLKALLPELKQLGILSVLPAADPRQSIAMPAEVLELNGNKNPISVDAAQAYLPESLLLKKRTALPWR